MLDFVQKLALNPESLALIALVVIFLRYVRARDAAANKKDRIFCRSFRRVVGDNTAALLEVKQVLAQTKALLNERNGHH